jgi:hypothetical protein
MAKTTIRPAAARRRVAMTLLTAAALASSARAAAEAPPDAEVSRRLAFIEARLERATPSACLWWSAWYYKRIVSSVITLVSGVGITEAQIFTRPTAAIDDWRAYQQGAWGGSTPTASGPRAPWSVVAHPGGAGVAIAF